VPNSGKHNGNTSNGPPPADDLVQHGPSGPARLGGDAAVQPDPARLVLARLFSTLIGVFIGLLAAYGISSFYVSDFRELDEQGKASLANLKTGLEQTREEANRAKTQLELAQQEGTETPEMRRDSIRLANEVDRLNSQVKETELDLAENLSTIKLLDFLSAAVLILSIYVGYSG
jgi:hypothetical protein